ncbi:hypothetical protein ABTG30_18995, partial [Acinetobacter baumannii]
SAGCGLCYARNDRKYVAELVVLRLLSFYLCLPVSNEHYCLTEYSVYHLIYRKNAILMQTQQVSTD